MLIAFVFCMAGFIIQTPESSKIMESENYRDSSLVYIKNKDFIRGMEAANRSIEIVPENSEAFYYRAFCKLFLGDYDGSCNDFHQASDQGYYKGIIKFDTYCDSLSQLKVARKIYYEDDQLFSVLGSKPAYTRADTLRGALRIERTCFDVIFYDLTVRIDPRRKQITGSNEIWFRGQEESSVIQIDLFENFSVDTILMNASSLPWHREQNALFINMPEKIRVGEVYKLLIYYHGKPVKALYPPWKSGFVWSRDKFLNPWVCVVCEHLGASSWWPNKDHLTDEPDSMKITIEVPEKFQAVSNGRLRSIKETDNNYKRFEWFVSYPINNYDVTFYMGKYIEFTDTLFTRWGKLVTRYDVLPYQLKKAKKHFYQTNEILAFYISIFGDFPFRNDDYKLVASPYEGMENQTAIAYGQAFDKYVKKKPYLKLQYDDIIVHETAHEWWGNAISAGDMADVWIHEGFAIFSEFLFVEYILGYDEYLAEVQLDMLHILNFWPMVGNRNVNENAFAGNDVYYKGAMMLHCLRSAMNNDDQFYDMIRGFYQKYCYKIVTSEDFIQFVNSYTQIDYSPFFHKYLYDTKIPILLYTYQRKDGELILKYKWSGVEDGFFMPFSVRLIGSNQESIRLVADTQEKEIHFKDATSFEFYNMFSSLVNCPHNGLTYFNTYCGNWE